MAITFPAVATIVAFIAAHWRVLAGASPAMYVLPLLIGAATFWGLRRVMTDRQTPTTVHQYSVFAPTPAGEAPVLRQLIDRLTAHGYQPDTVTLDEVGTPGPRPGHELDLIGAQLRITDKRGAAELGSIAVRLRRGEDGGMVGLVEATDTGPGVYDEMAQFAIVALGEMYAGMEYLAAGAKPERRPAGALRESLPESPLGLVLL
jgi:hypothetical protein